MPAAVLAFLLLIGSSSSARGGNREAPPGRPSAAGSGPMLKRGDPRLYRPAEVRAPGRTAAPARTASSTPSDAASSEAAPAAVRADARPVEAPVVQTDAGATVVPAKTAAKRGAVGSAFAAIGEFVSWTSFFDGERARPSGPTDPSAGRDSAGRPSLPAASGPHLRGPRGRPSIPSPSLLGEPERDEPLLDRRQKIIAVSGAAALIAAFWWGSVYMAGGGKGAGVFHAFQFVLGLLASPIGALSGVIIAVRARGGPVSRRMRVKLSAYAGLAGTALTTAAVFLMMKNPSEWAFALAAVAGFLAAMNLGRFYADESPIGRLLMIPVIVLGAGMAMFVWVNLGLTLAAMALTLLLFLLFAAATLNLWA